MPAPIGKHETPITGRKPWKVESVPQTKRPLTKTSQAEIDICLQCKRLSCNSGNCEAIRLFDRRQQTKLKPIPKDFLRRSEQPGNTVPVLAEHYGVSEHMVLKWRNASGIKNVPTDINEDDFVRDARAGMKLRDIMNKYRVGSHRAHRLYAKYNIPIPPKGWNGKKEEERRKGK